MPSATILSFVDMHTAGEPVRIITGGYPDLAGASVLAQRRDARERFDRLRRAVMHEPRGHAGMYGVIPVRPSQPDSAMAVLFTHGEGYSTMCGHATIALGRYAVDHGLVPAAEPMTRFTIEAPCGWLALRCAVEGGEVRHVWFESVPSFVSALDVAVDVPGLGRVVADIAYGGAFYAILPASRLGLDFFATPLADLVDAAARLTDALRAGLTLSHPLSPDLAFLYGTILIDDAPGGEETWNLCVFAERQIDRSPTGSGVSARMALDHARGLIGTGQSRIFRGISGQPFSGTVTRAAVGAEAVHVEVGAMAHYTGKGEFMIEAHDPLGFGFEVAPSFAAARRGA